MVAFDSDILIFADTASLDDIKRIADDPYVSGFTTNPSLMKAAGITDYEKFAKEAIEWLNVNRPDTCLSLEVFADDFDEMYDQADEIDSWIREYDNYMTYVKIPITNTKGESSHDLIHRLALEGINVNVTAVFTEDQGFHALEAFQNTTTPGIVSVFAGRIADAGVNPKRVIKPIRHYRHAMGLDQVQLLWASTRQPYSVFEAKKVGCDIITLSPAMIEKMNLFGKDLGEFSLETVNQFYQDAVSSGYSI